MISKCESDVTDDVMDVLKYEMPTNLKQNPLNEPLYLMHHSDMLVLIVSLITVKGHCFERIRSVN